MQRGDAEPDRERYRADGRPAHHRNGRPVAPEPGYDDEVPPGEWDGPGRPGRPPQPSRASAPHRAGVPLREVWPDPGWSDTEWTVPPGAPPRAPGRGFRPPPAAGPGDYPGTRGNGMARPGRPGPEPVTRAVAAGRVAPEPPAPLAPAGGAIWAGAGRRRKRTAARGRATPAPWRVAAGPCARTRLPRIRGGVCGRAISGGPGTPGWARIRNGHTGADRVGTADGQPRPIRAPGFRAVPALPAVMVPRPCADRAAAHPGPARRTGRARNRRTGRARNRRTGAGARARTGPEQTSRANVGRRTRTGRDRIGATAPGPATVTARTRSGI